jgi:YidC/Oxa1 family membrane protein insertase
MRSLLVPLSIQQSKSAEYMKALKPYMADIREKFKDNEEAQNNAISKLYEDANQNPLAGCFVSLAQLPVFLGLYRGVRLLALDGELQEPFLWIPSLQGPVSAPDYRGMDWITAGWTPGLEGSSIPVPALGWETTLAFLAMPVVLVLLQSLTMSTLQPPIDENATQEERETLEKSQGFLKFLPLMIGFFSLQVPAGLTIYWFTSNLFTLSQSLAVKAYFRANPPKIELPEYWDTALAKDADFDKMSPEERRKAMEAGIRVGPTFEDMVDESRFHCLMERKALRGESAAWLRLEGSSGSIPTEMESWVKNVKVEPVPAEATV